MHSGRASVGSCIEGHGESCGSTANVWAVHAHRVDRRSSGQRIQDQGVPVQRCSAVWSRCDVITQRRLPLLLHAAAMPGAVPLLLLALALLLRLASAGASVSAPARGDQDHGPVGPGPGRGHGHGHGGASDGTGTAYAVTARGAAAEAAPRRAIGADPGRSTLLARGRVATAAAGPTRTHAYDDATPCRLGRPRAGRGQMSSVWSRNLLVRCIHVAPRP